MEQSTENGFRNPCFLNGEKKPGPLIKRDPDTWEILSIEPTTRYQTGNGSSGFYSPEWRKNALLLDQERPDKLILLEEKD